VTYSVLSWDGAAAREVFVTRDKIINHCVQSRRVVHFIFTYFESKFLCDMDSCESHSSSFKLKRVKRRVSRLKILRETVITTGLLSSSSLLKNNVYHKHHNGETHVPCFYVCIYINNSTGVRRTTTHSLDEPPNYYYY
jgi:hypothetical protein